MPIWLAARECLAKDREQLWPAGEKLAARAAAAAKRQQDVLLATALYREWGQLEVDRGFKEKGEARWAELMEWTLPKQPVTKTAAAPSSLPAIPPPVAPMPTQQAPLSWRHAALRMLVLMQVGAQPVLVSPGRQQSATRSTELAPTEDQFKRAYEIALLAADKQMTALSLRTMLQAVRGGPPVVVNQVRNSGGSYQTRMIGGKQYYTQGGNDKRVGVDRALLTLIPKWRALNVPLSQVYDVMVAAVLPQSRPAEVFLYAPTAGYGNLYVVVNRTLVPATDMIDESVVDRGLGSALVQVAIDAGKVDDLRTRLEARTTQPLGELPAKILLTMLALQAKDEPRITAAFASLGERLKKDTLQATVSTIAAVLTPALLDPKYAKQVAPLVDKAAQNYVVAGNVQAASELRFRLAEYYVQNKDEAAARAQIKHIEDADKKNVNQGYDVHMALADEYLKLDWLEDAIRELGMHADNPISQQNSGDMPMAQRPEPIFNLPTQFEKFVTLLLKLPASRRYEILKSWSLPTSGRKSIRYYVGTAPTGSPPEVFSKRLPFPEHRWMSTMQILAEAAKECGKLDELSTLAEGMAKEKVENAELFRLFVQLTGGKGKEIEPAVKAYVQRTRQRLTKKQEMPLGSRNYYGEGYQQPKLFYPSEFLIMTLCLSNPALTTQGEELLASFIGTPPAGVANMPAFKKIHEELRAKQSGASTALTPSYPDHWRTSTGKASWITEAGLLTVLPGSQPSMLLYDAPLTGAFELSVEARPSTLRAAGYGGITFHPGANRVESVVTGDTIQLSQQEMNAAGIEQPTFVYVDGRTQPALPRQADFKKIVLQVSPEKIRCLTDGRVFYEDLNPAPTSPWLMLPGMSEVVFRNVSLTGKPTVPAEVKLTGGDYLEGWQTYTYGGVLPKRLTAVQKARGDSMPVGNQYNPRGEEDEQALSAGDPVYDWLAKDGEIRGRKLDWPGEKASPSCLAYFRPLQTGEKLRYEFFYEPGKTHVYPSLGRVAFLLEPDGLKLHWMTSQTDSWTGLKSDNTVAPPTGSPGGKLGLKAKEWNALTVALNKDSAILTLNDVPVFEWKLTSTDERLFGLFHYRDQTDVRVRNVVLKGAWSTNVTTSESLSLAAKPGSPAEVKARRAVLGESLFAAESAKMLERIRPLSAKERYEVLLEWVLPNAQRPSYQLAGHLQPRDVLGIVDKPKQPAGRRVILGGQLQLAPLELVTAAKEAGQLDQLCVRLAKPASTPEDELDRRSRLALGAAAFAAKGDDKASADNLRELLKFATQMKTDAAGQERWPDLIAAYGTLHRPGLAAPLRSLVETINKNLEKSVVEKKIFDQRDWWLRACREICARVELHGFPDGQRLVNSSDSPFTHWASVPVSANSLITGGIPRWIMRDGALVHFPGFGDDLLILDTPLRGDFDVTCELRLQGWEEVYIRYGSCQFELQADRKHFKLQSTIKARARETLIAPPLPPSKENTYAFRLSVKDGWFRAYVDGKEIASRRLGSSPEPWLMLSCAQLNTGTVKNLQITGSPTVPDRIDLLMDDELGLWNAYTPHNWVKRGEELYGVGKKAEPPEPGLPVPARRTPEAATFYQRPMLEDGAIEYEFFFDPEKAHVHPMLHRLTFLLEPEGVKLHWLTDGVADQSDTRVDNIKDEPGCRRGPSQLALKPKQWNKVRLAVAGDVVKVDLNGQEVYERPIESTNQRLFGIFHYSDRTEARVRNLTYVGAWPKKLPSSSELFQVKK
ncbi:hypothetical protein BH10PLA2_BH10PLA2_04590 [soil metagenome]